MTKTVLIIDDQKGIRLLLEEIIRNQGYHAISFEDGISAISEIELNQPDLIIIDQQLPIKTGTEIVELLEEKGYDIPTIIMSGLIESAKTTAEKTKTVKAYFSKPFNIIEAKNTIKQLLENNQ